MADEEQRGVTPTSNHDLPAQQSSDDDRKAKGDNDPGKHTVSIENDTNCEAQGGVEEPQAGYLRGWRLHVLTAASDDPKTNCWFFFANVWIDYV